MTAKTIKAPLTKSNLSKRAIFNHCNGSIFRNRFIKPLRFNNKRSHWGFLFFKGLHWAVRSGAMGV